MNKWIGMGRLTKDPEIRYSQGAESKAVAKYSLAVNRRFKHQGQPDADFINCVAFGKAGEFAEKYLHKGMMISVVGRLQVRSWDDKGQKRWSTDVIVEEQYFAESKKPDVGDNASGSQQQSASEDGFYQIDETIEDDDLPF